MSVFRDYCSMDVNIPVSDMETKTVTITRNTRFFVPMTKLERFAFPFVGLTLSMRSYGSDTEMEWVECYINEDEYLINMNDGKDPPYKIKLTACDQSYGSETYYWTDFLSLLREGNIKVKESDFDVVVPYRRVNNIPNSCATIVEEGTVVVDVRNYM